MKKVVLITGASSGMGKDAALKLISEGHVVYGAARRVEKMQDIADAGGHALKMDVMDNRSVKESVAKIMEQQGRIDVLLNNAGYATSGSVEDTSLEDARRQFEVNLFGLAAVTKEVLPVMRKQKSGRIINTSSMGGKMYTPLSAWYHATKHALEGWSDCLRLEVAPFGIDVVILEPGVIATEFDEVMLQPMLERSAGGPYEPMAQALAKATRTSYRKGGASPASVISNVISRVVQAKRPKTRYAAGKYARPMIFIRKWFGDRAFDKVVMSMVKK